MEIISALSGAPMVTEAAAARVETEISASWGMVRKAGCRLGIVGGVGNRAVVDATL